MISLHNMLPFELTKEYFYEYFNRNWSCYKGFLLYAHWFVLLQFPFDYFNRSHLTHWALVMPWHVVTLVQITTCCLTAQRHYLNQYLFIINEVLCVALTTKHISNPYIILVLCAGNPLTGGFPSQSVSNIESVPHHDVIMNMGAFQWFQF